MKALYKLICIIFSLILFNSSLFAAKILNVIHYEQCGQNWSLIQLGSCGQTVCQVGCAVDIMAMMLWANGTGATPGTVANFMNSHNYWSGQCDMDWIKVCTYPGSTMHWTSSPVFSTSTVRTQIDNNNPVGVFVLLPGNLTHFVLIYGYVNNGTAISDFQVLDPLKSYVTNLDTYNIQNLRLFDSVINTSVTCSFKINNTVLQAYPNEYKVIKYPPIPNNFYDFTASATNRNGNTWEVYLYRPNGDSVLVAGNLNVDEITIAFNVDSLNSWFPNSQNYKFKILERTTPRTVWAVSPSFDISTLPRVSIDPLPDTLHVGQPVTIRWYVVGGVPGLFMGGWQNNIQIQFQFYDTAKNVIATPLVSSNSYTFNMPSVTGGPVPSGHYRISVSNPPGSTLPTGYIYAYSNYFYLSNAPIGILPVSEIIPFAYKLYDNYPNPFNPTTNIKFDISKNGLTSLKVFDVLGSEVASLINEELNAGTYEIKFNGSNLSSGMYFYRIESGDFRSFKKMVLVK